MSGGGNQTSSQTAYAQILQMILTRKIQGGEKLTEERLTDLLNMSRRRSGKRSGSWPMKAWWWYTPIASRKW